jgi:biotin carboxylase
MGNTKTLLVLGASRYQLDVISAAKQLGYRVVTTDNVPSNPGHLLADRSYSVDTTDYEGVLEIAQKERIAGIIAPATDVAVPTAAFVSEKLGLSGPPYKSTQITCDKVAFRRFLLRHGFPVPPMVPISKDNVFDLTPLGPPPWIMKPDCSSGSKGVFVIEGIQELYQRLPETWNFVRRQALVEKYVEGWQGTVEGIIHNGKIMASFILDRQTVPLPYAATSGHRLPSRLPSHLQQVLLEQLRAVWRLLDIIDAVFDCDFVATDQEIFLLELSPRLGGNSISRLLRIATGFNLIEYAIRLACSESQPLPQNFQITPTAIILLGVHQSGRLHYNTEELTLLQKEPWVKNIEIDHPIYTYVHKFINGRYRVGEAILQTSDRDELDLKAAEFVHRLRLTAIPE